MDETYNCCTWRSHRPLMPMKLVWHVSCVSLSLYCWYDKRSMLCSTPKDTTFAFKQTSWMPLKAFPWLHSVRYIFFLIHSSLSIHMKESIIIIIYFAGYLSVPGRMRAGSRRCSGRRRSPSPPGRRAACRWWAPASPACSGWSWTPARWASPPRRAVTTRPRCRWLTWTRRLAGEGGFLLASHTCLKYRIAT